MMFTYRSDITRSVPVMTAALAMRTLFAWPAMGSAQRVFLFR